MPLLGRPASVEQSQFSNISMKKSEPTPNAIPGAEEQKNDPRLGDQLNKISGVKPEQRYVDRKSHEQLGQDGFLKLLAAQLKNQDPMKPMDQKIFHQTLLNFHN